MEWMTTKLGGAAMGANRHLNEAAITNNRGRVGELSNNVIGTFDTIIIAKPIKKR